MDEVGEYLISVHTRFAAMDQAGIDCRGLAQFEAMIRCYLRYEWIRPGHFEYLMDRTDSRGRWPDYNQRYSEYGVMLPFPHAGMVEITNWRLPVSYNCQRYLRQRGYSLRTLRQARIHAEESELDGIFTYKQD